MENVYEFHEVTAPWAKFGITIRRKPSQIPYGIDRDIGGAISGHVELDGPNNRVTYLFMTSDEVSKAEEYLQRCGWRRAS